MSEVARTPALVPGATLDISDMVLPSEYARVHAAARPERIGLIFGAARWSYAALDRAIDQMVRVLEERDVRPGNRVAYLGRNNDLFLWRWPACCVTIACWCRSTGAIPRAKRATCWMILRRPSC